MRAEGSRPRRLHFKVLSKNLAISIFASLAGKLSESSASSIMKPWGSPW
jgi:hypothetical protein